MERRFWIREGKKMEVEKKVEDGTPVFNRRQLQ